VIVVAAEEYVLEEIIVTAQRIEESAQKVPIALNAFDESSIEDRQIVGIADLSILVPNLNYTSTNVGDANVSIRGIGSLVSVPVEASGNRLPESPEHTVHVAASYTWDVFAGALTARWDYYW
jgi:iron complex outermembrane receptor protein